MSHPRLLPAGVFWLCYLGAILVGLLWGLA